MHQCVLGVPYLHYYSDWRELFATKLLCNTVICNFHRMIQLRRAKTAIKKTPKIRSTSKTYEKPKNAGFLCSEKKDAWFFFSSNPQGSEKTGCLTWSWHWRCGCWCGQWCGQWCCHWCHRCRHGRHWRWQPSPGRCFKDKKTNIQGHWQFESFSFSGLTKNNTQTKNMEKHCFWNQHVLNFHSFFSDRATRPWRIRVSWSVLCLTPCAGNGFAAFRGDGMKTGLPLRAWRRSYCRGSAGKIKDAFAFIAEHQQQKTNIILGKEIQICFNFFVFGVWCCCNLPNLQFLCRFFMWILPASMEVIWIRLGAKGLSCQKALSFREIRFCWMCVFCGKKISKNRMTSW